MKLAEWARQQGLDYKTAYRWFRAGIMPVPCTQLPTGTILVFAEETVEAQLKKKVADLEKEIAKLKGGE